MENDVYTYANVRRWTNRPAKVNIFEVDKVLFPVNVGNVSVPRCDLKLLLMLLAM